MKGKRQIVYKVVSIIALVYQPIFYYVMIWMMTNGRIWPFDNLEILDVIKAALFIQRIISWCVWAAIGEYDTKDSVFYRLVFIHCATVLLGCVIGLITKEYMYDVISIGWGIIPLAIRYKRIRDRDLYE